MNASPICDKDHVLISCRRVIKRFLEANLSLDPAVRRYAEMVANEAYEVMGDMAQRVSRQEE